MSSVRDTSNAEPRAFLLSASDAPRIFEPVEAAFFVDAASSDAITSRVSDVSDMRPARSATSSPHLVLKKEHFPEGGDPVFLLDLAVPRDIDPAIAELPNVTLFDVDSLKQTAQESMRHRRELEEQGRAMLLDSVTETMDWLASSRVDSTVQSLQQLCREAEDDTCALLESKLALGEHEKRVLRKFIHAGMRRLVRAPILTLKGLRDETEQEQYMEAVERLFQMKGESGHEDSQSRNAGL